MTGYVAFLRAINVGGSAVVRMTHLRDAFVAAGCANVRTFIASGNVVFEAPPGRQEALFTAIRGRVRRLLGREPTICFRTIREIERLVRSDPFRGRRNERALKLYVAFLAEKPRATLRLPASLPKEGLEAFRMTRREVFIASRRKPNGFYGFPNIFVEQLGVRATTRNWSTVTKIVEFAAIPRAPSRPGSAPAPPARGGRAGTRSRAS